MDIVAAKKPHAVCVPFPIQGHITPMMKVAKILHSKGFHITFVNSEYNHRRLLRSQGSSALDGLPDFRFEAIPDGLPPSDGDASQDIATLWASVSKNCSTPFRNLLSKLNNDPSSVVPPVTCIVAGTPMTFTLDGADEIGVPVVCFWTSAACSLLCLLHLQHLIDRGIVPLKSMDDYTNGCIDKVIDWIPGFDDMTLRHFPSFVLELDISNSAIVNLLLTELPKLQRASSLLINTFHDLEQPVLDGLSSILLPPLYTIGPLHLLSNSLLMKSSLWKEQEGCIEWLQGRKPRSVVYVNFGSIAVITNDQLIEFAWGLANSEYDFLWVIRPDLVKGESPVLPLELVAAIEGRSLLADWCSQEQVLRHAAVGGFLTHCGWNSTMESIGCGVPMICWPFFSEQPTNCHYLCSKWGVGLEIDGHVKRENVEEMIREMMMEGEKGKEMRNKALEWKKAAVRATLEDGSSFQNIEKLVKEVMLPCKAM